MVPRYEKLGFHAVWNTYVTKLDVQNVTKKLAGHESQLDGVSINPASAVDFEKVCSYDDSVFGTQRDRFVETWINMPGSLCWVAVAENGDVVGYIVVRQFINRKGKEIQLGLAPLYANNDRIAISLLKVAAKSYQSNEATSSSGIDLFYGDGRSCGHASRLTANARIRSHYISPWTKDVHKWCTPWLSARKNVWHLLASL